MNVVRQLQQVLSEEKLIAPGDAISISLSIGEANRKRSRLSRRYVITKNSQPFLMGRFIPRDWPFSHDDIARTYSVYSSFTSFKVPRLVGRVTTPEGTIFLEEFLPSAVSLNRLIDAKEIEPAAAKDVVREIVAEIWQAAGPPSKEFVQEEKGRYHEYLSSFVRRGVLGETILSHVDRVIDDHLGSLRRAWSTGDIIDRNILRCGSQWYLVDFEYSHETLFLFKEVFRTVHYFPWAQRYSIREMFPALGEFPEDVARLLSLSWDQHLQSEIVAGQAHAQNEESLRRTFWSVFDETFPERLDRKVATLKQLADDREAKVTLLGEEKGALQRILKSREERIDQLQRETERRESQVNQLEASVRALEAASKEQAEHVMELGRSIADLQRERDEANHRFSESSAELARHRNTLAKSLNDLARLRDELAKAGDVIKERDKHVELKKRESAQLHAELRMVRTRFDQLKDVAQRMQGSLQESDRLVASQRTEIQRMQRMEQTVFSTMGFRLLRSFWAVKDFLLGAMVRGAVEGLGGGSSAQSSDASPDANARPVVDIPTGEELAIALAASTPPAGSVVAAHGEVILTESRLAEELAASSTLETESTYRDAYRESLKVAQVKMGSDYVPLRQESVAFHDAQVKLIAFYLPQYHPIPENDAWWGRGFTEWTNVSKAVAQFEGHYQPHLPGELGFYDLRVPEVQRRQVELAKSYGIHGFCFHYYWFNGKRLLERPLDQFISDPKIDFPFCICWANENWTRRWDGQESDILMAQVHSEETDLGFIKDVASLFRHKNYIRVNGRPLLVIYRVGLMPNAAETALRWKKYCKEAGIEEPYLVAAQSFGFVDPRTVGFDAAVEFPPHNVAFEEITQKVRLYNSEFAGRISSYPDMVVKMQEYNKGKPFTVFKTVSPGWDNEARKPGRGHVYANSSPELYRTWLDGSCRFVLDNPSPDERLVFINAWNEWGEGAHLEPDARYGYAYLESTRDVVKSYVQRPLKVSVVLPNYNREPFIVRRLESILHQSRKPDEIIFLDDASTDDSLRISEEMLKKSAIKYRILRNEKNSGSVFKQWLKGINEAEGDLIWICESDDDAHTDFLKNILPQFNREDVLLAYGDMSYINADGSRNDGLADYYRELSSERWKSSHIRTAHDVFSRDFAVKNIVPNASGAVFRKPVISDAEIERLLTYKFAGDWYFYALVLRGGSIGFCKEAKSYFRVHETSNSRKAFFTPQHVEEHRMILEDLRAMYGISDEAVAGHVAELTRVLDLRGGAEKNGLKGDLFTSVQPKNAREKLKICIASYGFIIGGGEVVPILLANAMRALGHHVTFLVMNTGSSGDSEPLRPRLRRDIPILRWDGCAHSFADTVKDFGFDVINSHNVDVEYKLFNSRIEIDVPYVSSLHGGYETVPDLLKPDFVSFLSRTVDAWLFLSEKNYTPLLNGGLKTGRYVKVFNALAPMSRENGKQSSARASLRLPKESIVLVIASRAIQAKGWGVAIDATRKLRAETKKDVQLVLIGDGEDMDTLRESARGDAFIHFMGRVENAGAVIHGCDIGVFPSTFSGESFPMFVLECFDAGLPVVATDVGAIREMMVTESGELAGALIPPSPEVETMTAQVASAVAKLIRNRETLRSAQRAAKKRAERYSMGSMVGKYLEVFQSIISEKVR